MTEIRTVRQRRMDKNVLGFYRQDRWLKMVDNKMDVMSDITNETRPCIGQRVLTSRVLGWNGTAVICSSLGKRPSHQTPVRAQDDGTL